MGHTSAPVPAGRVPRPALFERLESAVRRPVTVVVAPAGSGKTVLVRSWLDQREPSLRSAWVSVEPGERDEQRFWGSVATALADAVPNGIRVPPVVPTPDHDSDAALDRLVADLAPMSEPLVLVLDEVHEVVDPELRRHLASFLAHLPGALHVVLVTRRDLQLGLHRRRLEGELAEIRVDELRFSRDQTRQLLQARGIVLSEQSTALLHERTEGWVAGLALAVVSLVDRADRDGFVAEFSGSERTVAEYLVAEVLDAQAPEVRRLLLRTSLLDRVNGELGDLLTGGSDSQRRLQDLADSGAFVIALDASRTWFRFHPLFADLLGLQLRHDEGDQVPGLHRAAATWFDEHGLPVEAVAHAQAAGDHRLAAGLLLAHHFTLALDGRQASAHALLGGYALEPADNPPETALVLANDELAGGSLDQAAAQLALAELHADQVPGTLRRKFDVGVLLTRLTLARRLGDFRSVLAGIGPLEVVVEPQTSLDILVDNDVRALVATNLGIVEVWSGSLVAGTVHLRLARDLARQIGRPYLEVGALAHLALAETASRTSGSQQVCREAIALAERYGWGADPVVAPALVALGDALVQAGRLEEGELWLAHADAALRPDLEPAVGFLLAMAHGAAHLARGRHPEALVAFRRAGDLGSRLVTASPLSRRQVTGTLYALLGAGDREAVRSALDVLPDADRDTARVREVLGALALAEGDPTAALTAVQPTLDPGPVEGTPPAHDPAVLVRSLVVAALAHDARGEARRAEDALERALDVADSDDLVLPFLFLSPRDLLERHPRHRTEHGAFVRVLLDALSGAPRAAAGHSTVPPVLEPLSDAELRLLRYLPTNLTAAGISETLFVTTNTVKTHMHHVYAKLGAHTRAEAVQRARALGLLGTSSSRS